MARNKITIDFNGYSVLERRLKEIGGNARKTAESALKASHNVVTKKLNTAIAPHKETGETEKSLDRTPDVKWTGDIGETKVGFNIADGGLPSIFLMYGTKMHGQPHISPDKALYDAVYGTKTKKEIQKIQRETYEKSIERAMRK
ncbi:MAG: hypothetical protein IJJ69_08665 [Oscillospiraceae bacterium]|nr:hypothetical protein [Oscillospiraceae bacterium]